MKNLNSHTGYLQIDHSNSPGIRAEDIPVRLRGITPIVGEGEVKEFDTKNCTHCESNIVLNPLRTRNREICPHCHHYICDRCYQILKATGQCIPFKKIVDKLFDSVVKGEPLIIIP